MYPRIVTLSAYFLYLGEGKVAIEIVTLRRRKLPAGIYFMPALYGAVLSQLSVVESGG